MSRVFSCIFIQSFCKRVIHHSRADWIILMQFTSFIFNWIDFFVTRFIDGSNKFVWNIAFSTNFFLSKIIDTEKWLHIVIFIKMNDKNIYSSLFVTIKIHSISCIVPIFFWILDFYFVYSATMYNATCIALNEWMKST